LWIERDSIEHWNYLLDYFLPRNGQKHSVQKPLFLGAPRIQRRKGIRQSERVRAAVHRRLEQCAKSVGEIVEESQTAEILSNIKIQASIPTKVDK